MKRHNSSALTANDNGRAASNHRSALGPGNYNNAKSKSSPFASKIYWMSFCVTSVFIAVALYDSLVNALSSATTTATTNSITTPVTETATKPVRRATATESRRPPSSGININVNTDRSLENSAFENVIDRTKHYQQHCELIGLLTKNDEKEQPTFNNHTAHLPRFGFLDAFRNYQAADPSDIDNAYPYRCALPPETECGETQFTVIFMAYNPDRLAKLLNQIDIMLNSDDFSKIVAEVIVVWNGERHVNETDLGKKLIELETTLPLRISYPLKEGFPNDLMNRYHPRLEVKTKAIMYYDDDGPFYKFKATLGGFELWKRNSNAQIGAMARKLDLGPRQAEESKKISGDMPNDRFFVSQCPTDDLHYNYFTFANFDARMVLPSGSFLHSNFLCFLWHPIFEDVRKYVRQHPVNPDDGTVSMLVSQLAGRAPKVYPRRTNNQKDKSEQTNSNANANANANADNPPQEQQRRRLMDGINWDAPGAHAKKMNWGALRSDVANSLARYFGSVNSGSLGWCYGTKYHTVKGRKKESMCEPEMAKPGMLPWMTEDYTVRDVCP
eukprot:CAMPEP_0168202676 /NCGR_PEP_ID=MMETSP0139_2-20121125/24416_1 /TAXON_ID=44445 /ORGANISM="Pseudo-nitzschia australis, Strain 10249 10 AB" /LENGTH=555 /DNA_ID=CAMNT_0008128413 /DNA_START=41 /DNA_END=1708 /DNA_ORIENTATION=-